jgi:D-alanine--D-alanine ligase
MVEPLAVGKRELECGYFATKCQELFTNPGEILTDSFYDYRKKYGAETKTVATAQIDDRIKELIIEYSRRMVHSLGVRQIARIDFFLWNGVIYFNEINTMPGFTADSLYPKMLAESGVAPNELLKKLCEGAL